MEEVFKDVDTSEERPEKFSIDQCINTLKELAERGRCSIPEYYFSDEQIIQDGELWWECTCRVSSWRLEKTALGKTKKIAKKYAAYQLLCEHFEIENEYE